MRMDHIHPTVIKIINSIQGAEMKRFIEKSEEDKRTFQKIFADGLTVIINKLPT